MSLFCTCELLLVPKARRCTTRSLVGSLSPPTINSAPVINFEQQLWQSILNRKPFAVVCIRQLSSKMHKVTYLIKWVLHWCCVKLCGAATVWKFIMESGRRRQAWSLHWRRRPASRKRKRSNSEKAGLLVDTIRANRLKAEAHLDLYKTMDFDAISRCQF